MAVFSSYKARKNGRKERKEGRNEGMQTGIQADRIDRGGKEGGRQEENRSLDVCRWVVDGA